MSAEYRCDACRLKTSYPMEVGKGMMARHLCGLCWDACMEWCRTQASKAAKSDGYGRPVDVQV